MVRACLFDLDGTLVDTLPDLAEAVNRTLVEVGRPPRPYPEIASFVGDGIGMLVRRALTVGTHAEEDEIAAALERFRAHYRAINGVGSRVYPDVPETLERLAAQGKRLAVVTNKATEFTLPLLQRLGLAPYFSTVVCGDTLPVKKPDPAVVRHALAALETPPESAVLVGDSRNDALAAAGAGVPVLLVTYGYSEGQPVLTLPARAHLERFADVLNYVA